MELKASLNFNSKQELLAWYENCWISGENITNGFEIDEEFCCDDIPQYIWDEHWLGSNKFYCDEPIEVWNPAIIDLKSIELDDGCAVDIYLQFSGNGNSLSDLYLEILDNEICELINDPDIVGYVNSITIQEGASWGDYKSEVEWVQEDVFYLIKTKRFETILIDQLIRYWTLHETRLSLLLKIFKDFCRWD